MTGQENKQRKKSSECYKSVIIYDRRILSSGCVQNVLDTVITPIHPVHASKKVQKIIILEYRFKRPNHKSSELEAPCVGQTHQHVRQSSPSLRIYTPRLRNWLWGRHRTISTPALLCF